MQELKLDLSIKKGIDLVHAKQRDVGTKILVKLTDNKVEYVVPDGVTWSVWYSGASGEGNYDKIDGRDAVVVNGSTATVELIYQMLNNSGGGEMCLVMNGTDGIQLGLWNIPYFVEAIPGADSAAAVQYYQAFLQAQAKAEAAAARAEKAAGDARDAAESAINKKPQDLKVTATFDTPVDDPTGSGRIITNGSADVSAYEIAVSIKSGTTAILVDNDNIVYEYNGYRLDPNYSNAFFRAEVPNANGITVYSVTIDSEGNASRVEFTFDYVGNTNDAVLYTPQTLTAEQQAQARENIKAATIDDTKAGADAWSSKNTVDRLCPAFTESGSVVACEPVEGYPLEVVSKIEPVQSGSGDPSPDNIRPITGHSAVKLTRCGKNLLKLALTSGTYNGLTVSVYEDGRIDVKGTATGGSINLQERLVLTPGTYTFSVGGHINLGSNGDCIWVYGDGVAMMFNDRSERAFTVTETSTVRVYFYTVSGTQYDITIYPQIELNDSATEYEPYRGETFEIDLGQTVYGGNLDWNTGVLTIDMATLSDINLQGRNYPENTEFVSGYVVSNWREPSSPILCDKLPVINWDDNNKWTQLAPYAWYYNGTVGVAVPKSIIGVTDNDNNESITQKISDYVNNLNLTIAYKLIEPITIQLTPQEILALSGINTLYSDTGDTEVTGRANPAAVIEKLTNAILSLGGNV